jgi:hypothetical protein
MNPAIDVLVVGIGAMLAGALWLLSEDFFDHYGLMPWRVPSGCWVVLVAVVSTLAVVVPSDARLAGLLASGVLVLWLLARVTTWRAVAGPRELERRLALQRPLLAGWMPDPAARHERRYFDGRYWTAWVFDGGVTSKDPLALDAPAPHRWDPAPGFRPPPAWHADPSGRYEHRYWDGERWTDWVSDGDDMRLDLPA